MTATPDEPSKTASSAELDFQTASWKELSQPPVIDIAEAPLTRAKAESTAHFWSRLEQGKEPDSFKLYTLAHQAEILRERSIFHRLLCERYMEHAEFELPHINAIRRMIREMHSRVLLCHTPGMQTRLEIAMVIGEHILRGLSHRVLLLSSEEGGALWREELRTRCGLSFSWWPELPSSLADVPRHLILPSSVMTETVPEALTKEGLFDLIVVLDAFPLRRRRSRLWKNLLALSPPSLVLQDMLPISQEIIDLHGMLALLGVPELPPPSLLRREMGLEDTSPQSITPQSRKIMRGLLQANTLRNTPEVYTPPESKFLWKPQDVAAFPGRQGLSKKLCAWVHQNESDDAARNTALSAISRAFASSPAALAASLESFADNPAWAAQREAMLALATDAAQVQAQDPRIVPISQLLKRRGHMRALVCCGHRATLDALVRGLRKEKVSFRSPTHPERDASVVLATDSDIPNIRGPIDMVVHVDLPWHPSLFEHRNTWLLSQQGDERREIWTFALKAHPTTRLLELIEFRWKHTSLEVGELPLLARFMDEAHRFAELPKHHATAVHQGQEQEFFEALSSALLNARKQYRRLVDTNQRLFLDDYAI